MPAASECFAKWDYKASVEAVDNTPAAVGVDMGFAEDSLAGRDILAVEGDSTLAAGLDLQITRNKLNCIIRARFGLLRFCLSDILEHS